MKYPWQISTGGAGEVDGFCKCAATAGKMLTKYLKYKQQTHWLLIQQEQNSCALQRMM